MWIPLILILLILGGIFILFLYIIRLIPNKKLTFNKKIIILIIFLLISFPLFKISEISFFVHKFKLFPFFNKYNNIYNNLSNYYFNCSNKTYNFF